MFYVQEVTKMVTTRTTGYQGVFYLWEIFQWMRLHSQAERVLIKAESDRSPSHHSHLNIVTMSQQYG